MLHRSKSAAGRKNSGISITFRSPNHCVPFQWLFPPIGSPRIWNGQRTSDHSDHSGKYLWPRSLGSVIKKKSRTMCDVEHVRAVNHSWVWRPTRVVRKGGGGEVRAPRSASCTCDVTTRGEMPPAEFSCRGETNLRIAERRANRESKQTALKDRWAQGREQKRECVGEKESVGEKQRCSSAVAAEERVLHEPLYSCGSLIFQQREVIGRVILLNWILWRKIKTK